MSIGPWDFNGFDVVVLLVILISLLMAASRGFWRELISITALVFAGGLALFVFGRYRFAAQDFIKPSWLADGALGLGTFALGYMLIVFFLSMMTKPLRGKEVGLFDRLLGAGFGAARGLLVMALFTMVATAQYRESLAANEFKDHMIDNQGQMDPEVLEKMPKHLRDWMDEPPAELPAWLAGSTFYPLTVSATAFAPCPLPV